MMNSITFLGNYAPRRCGIATFTQDFRASVMAARPGLKSDVVMVTDEPAGYTYPGEVRMLLSETDRADYRRVAHSINRSGIDCISLQHEFGIYGGPDGEWILDLLETLRVPVVTTCHTLLQEPSPGQRRVLRQVGRESAHLVVMAQKGRELLRDVFEVPDGKISVIPHGIPDTVPAPGQREETRRSLGWCGRSVLLTFGLLSPNKGIEQAIRALPEIVRHHPEVLYVVVGATHPNLFREQGEAYRESLQRLAERLDVTHHLQFLDRFVSRDVLVGLIDAADIYLTPYLSEAQITSGTLAIAFGMGKPVISTPYWHAAELLADGAGVLVPFNSSAALGRAASSLLGNPVELSRLSEQAKARGRAMTWSSVGRSYLSVFDRMASPSATTTLSFAAHGVRNGAASAGAPASAQTPVLGLSLGHLTKMSGEYGIFQHSKMTEPDPSHGFCLDDNARASIFLTSLSRSGAVCLPALDQLAQRCSASLFDGYNRRLSRFRNFMDSDGAWLEQAGSEDSHGRAMWAIGHSLSTAASSELKTSLTGLFVESCVRVPEFHSPRALAFILLGLHGYREAWPDSRMPRELQRDLAGRLLNYYRRSAAPGWEWFEDVVTYDNAKLPQALIATARQVGNAELLDAGVSSLKFLARAQTTRAGHFRPIGCEGFWRRGHLPAKYDQQPLEAQAMVAACLEAERATGDRSWLSAARHFHNWFHGANDLGIAIADAATGGCHDGLQENGLNRNQGAESTLAYLQASIDLIRRLRGASVTADAGTADRFPGGLSTVFVSAAPAA